MRKAIFFAIGSFRHGNQVVSLIVFIEEITLATIPCVTFLAFESAILGRIYPRPSILWRNLVQKPLKGF